MRGVMVVGDDQVQALTRVHVLLLEGADAAIHCDDQLDGHPAPAGMSGLRC
jgi:hypothetical protein